VRGSVGRVRTATIAVILFASAGASCAPQQEDRAAPPSAHAGAAVPEPGPDGWIELFDGRTLDGWSGDVAGWGVRDGAISCGPSGGNLWAPGEWSDFELSLEFRLTPGANNGIGIRAPGAGDAAYEGLEVQVLDDGHEKYAGWLKDWQRHGSVYGIAASAGGTAALRPAGEWNAETVTVRGRRVRVELNGTVILDRDLDEATRGGTLSGKDHPGLRRASGKVGFLGHGDRVDYRAVRLRPLTPGR
jgi:hypothetical protein